MRRAIIFSVMLLASAPTVRLAAASPAPQSERVVDRIVARIEGDIILESQVRELGAFQTLIEGRAEKDNDLISELIEQWMVQTEASASHFPNPAKSEVDRELSRLIASFPSPQAYATRIRELGLSADQVRELLSRQIYDERYLDYKFRPTVQVETSDIEAYYKNELLPELAKEKQPAPRMADVEDKIREVLVQRQISSLTAKWLDDTKSRLKIEQPAAGAEP